MDDSSDGPVHSPPLQDGRSVAAQGPRSPRRREDRPVHPGPSPLCATPSHRGAWGIDDSECGRCAMSGRLHQAVWGTAVVLAVVGVLAYAVAYGTLPRALLLSATLGLFAASF